MDLSTQYLGFTLKSPLVASASPLSEEVSGIKRLEDAGASAVVLYSLFEEQLKANQQALHAALTQGTESFAEALTYLPEPEVLRVGPEDYLKHIQAAKAAVDIPIIASLNAGSLGGWTDMAHRIEQAGADALELNIYTIPSDINLTGAEVEQMYVDIVREVRSKVALPLAIKLSPYFSNTANMAKRLVEAGANALVLFNRFYQPDIDLDHLEVVPHLQLSTSQAARLPMRWIAILYGRLKVDFAATSGVHNAPDVLKMMMVGANVAMMASVLLSRGPEHLKVVEQGLRLWMEEHEYDSIQQMQGSMSQINVENPSSFERAQYMRALKTFRPIFNK